MKRNLDQVVETILNATPSQATLHGFEVWLAAEQQIDTTRVYPAATPSMVFDMYRVEYAQAMLLSEILRYGTGTLEDAIRDAALIMADVMTQTRTNARVLKWLRQA